MLILGIDTSLSILSVALLHDSNLIGAVAMEGKGSRNEKLLPAIDWVLTESGIDRREIDLFAVTRGPGSFTGVRIGLATVQGMALALGKPVCAMSTHEAIAPAGGRWAVIDDAGRGELYVSLFEDGSEIEPPRLARPEELQGQRIAVADIMQRENVAAACARRAAAFVAAGRLDAYRDTTPIYVRLSEAEVKLRQKQNA
ncbi:MAG TPA: tRNA (adenosine(37)-N6)-threonylcarbamoyltransferase complex dimerization subunit type 1 TsaB [Thermoanaerobaculia bacterium]